MRRKGGEEGEEGEAGGGGGRQGEEGGGRGRRDIVELKLHVYWMFCLSVFAKCRRVGVTFGIGARFYNY